MCQIVKLFDEFLFEELEGDTIQNIAFETWQTIELVVKLYSLRDFNAKQLEI